ncbi:MAG: FAD-dependent oxidoreductase [Chloroflexi bacterium]|jgi:ferredoxin/flavodoxin---NADP+ reductase|nr:FAD-dependent oxidoreductase [Chloroflexota bacterium]
MHSPQYAVAVVGAGPAGLYAAQKLASAGAQVVIFNRDIKPGGLAEYGIYYNKYRMKRGLRKQFANILQNEQISYFGNIRVGEDGDLSLDDLRALGFQAILVTVGAQGTKWLGLPGEDLQGVYHAKDLVYHYNKLPPYSMQEFKIGKRVALIGVGNVMMDIAHWVVRDKHVDEVIAVARRGPAEVKFTKKEMQNIGHNLDLAALDDELARVNERMLAVGQNPAEAQAFILSGLKKALEPVSETRFRFEFLSSPAQIIGDEYGQVTGLEIDDTALALRDGKTKAQIVGTCRVLDVDTVVFCIGDKVDESFGLPIQWNSFVKNNHPRFPVDELSFEVYDPENEQPIEGVFVAGWSREASSGLVGYARKDGEMGAEAVWQYLQTLAPGGDVLGSVEQKLAMLPHAVVNKAQIEQLTAIEQARIETENLEDFKFDNNAEMLAILAAEALAA